tara:strand:- start:1147 stop:1293 length:147 start_codon:yes stop_codon:yes gene_type:complete
MDILIRENRILYGKKVSMTKEQQTRLHNYLHKYFSDFWQQVKPTKEQN